MLRISLRLILFLTVLLGVFACGDDPVERPRIVLDGSSMSGSDAGTGDADTGDAGSADSGGTDGPIVCTPSTPSCVTLPADDGVHDSAVEWWYWTGHLKDASDRWYGFQVTYFLFGQGVLRASLANMALTDVTGDSYVNDAEFSFAPTTVVPNGFSFALGAHTAVGGNGTDALHAEFEGASLDLTATTDRAAVLHHENGYVDYPFGGNTHYYSRPRMEVTGTVTIGTDERAVTGLAWFDHQWGELTQASSLGWDWMAIQLEDGRDVMLLSVRASPPYVAGTLVDGEAVSAIAADSITITPLDTWTSSESGCTYPLGFSVDIEDETFVVSPVRDQQEVVNVRDNSTTYWEGAATVTGAAPGRAYVELTGYCS